MRNTVYASLAISCLLFVGLACSRLGSLGKVDLFEGDNAAKAAAKIKEKVGSPTVNVISVEMRANELEVQIQSPSNPKNIDKYTFKDGSVTGPEPVQVISIGPLEMTGDKYSTTPIDDIGWANIPATVKQAVTASQLENGHVTLISMDNENPENGDPQLKETRQKEVDDLQKDIDARRKACTKDVATMGECWKALKPDEDRLHDLRFGPGPGKTKLVLTWRLFVEGPRGRKDFWADKNGKLNEKSF